MSSPEYPVFLVNKFLFCLQYVSNKFVPAISLSSNGSGRFSESETVLYSPDNSPGRDVGDDSSPNRVTSAGDSCCKTVTLSSFSKILPLYGTASGVVGIGGIVGVLRGVFSNG